MKRFDVIIIGAGPAGSLLGYYLAHKKIDTLIIDKKRLPRNKICGGGLTYRALDILPFDLSSIIDTYANTVDISIQNNSVFQYTSEDPVIGMVMRDQFDFFLTEKASHEGATVLDETNFKSLKGEAGNLIIQTSKGMFRSKLLIGADGIHSASSKALGLNGNKKKMIGLESEIVVGPEEIFNTFKNSACFDFGVIPNGYGWVFPKKNHLSVGVASISKKVKKMKNYLYNYIQTKRLDKNSCVTSLRGWHIPYGPSKKRLFANEKGIVIGDAAGLTDPITGEGIYYALKEAHIASEIISNKLLYNNGCLNDYNKALGPIRLDLAYALKLQWFFCQFPQLSYKIMKRHGERLGMNYLDIISGKTTYHALFKKIFSRHGIKTLFLGLINNNLGVFKKVLNRWVEGEK